MDAITFAKSRGYDFALKNVKYSAFASHETHCFEATLYLNGKRFCRVSNDGHGGMDNYYPYDGSRMMDLNVQIQEVNDVLSLDTFEDTLSDLGNNLEIVVGELMNEWLIAREIKRLLKKVCYFDPKTNKLFSLKGKLKPTPENFTKVKGTQWWKDHYVILNELSDADAMQLVRDHA